MSIPPREDQPLSQGRLFAVCAILLSATLINYACRTTFNQNSLQIQTAFRTGDDGYGQVEGLFGLGFACGGLLLIGVGALGVFPVYYSLNQELSASHQGRVSGSLSFSAWVVQFFVHPAVGQAFQQSPAARPYLFASIGVLPLLALAVLVLFWGKRES